MCVYCMICIISHNGVIYVYLFQQISLKKIITKEKLVQTLICGN